MKIMISIGTRPEGIKMGLLIKKMISNEQMEVVVCNTGQHKEMIEPVLKYYGIIPDYSLNVMDDSYSLPSLTKTIIDRMEPILLEEKPDYVFVHGDTASAYATALVCFYLKIPIIHIEAGLRTFNIYNPFPEEFYRISISRIAKYHFAPTEEERINLLKEGVSNENIFVVGNTVIDSVRESLSSDYTSDMLRWVGTNKLILVTVHRRENQEGKLRGIFTALNRLAEEFENVRILFPIHYSKKVREIASVILTSKRIKIIDPLNVYDFHNIETKSYLVISDSGGIQEETVFLGIPLLVVRDTTERKCKQIESMKLIGTDEDTIYSEAKNIIENELLHERMCKPANIYGDGFSCERIIGIISSIIKEKDVI